MKNKISLIVFLLCSIYSKGQWLDSLQILNRTNLTSSDTIVVKTFGYLGNTGWSIDTCLTEVNGNSIGITINACYEGESSIPTLIMFTVKTRIQPQATGNYNVVVKVIGHISINSVPCSSVITRDSLVTLFSVVEPNLINEARLSKDYKLFPNPVSDLLNFEIDEAGEEMRKIFIHNLLGQKVYEMNYSSKIKKIDVSGLQKGVYFLSVQSSGASIKYKFIKD